MADQSQGFPQNTFLMMQLARSNPALLSQLQASQRQQMLAQQLMQQGETPLPTDQTAGNGPGAFVIPISPWAAAAKAASTAIGGYELGQAQKNQNQLLSQALGGSQPPQASTQSPEAMNGAASTDNNGSPIAWNAPQGGTNTPGQVTPISNGSMDAGLLHRIAVSLGISDSDVTEGMMYNPAETLKAGMAALQNTPELAGARKGAEQMATIFPNTTYGGRENVPMTGAQIIGMNGAPSPAQMPGSPQITNTASGPAPIPPGPQTAAGQSLPPVPPYQPMPNVQPGQNGLPPSADMATMNAQTPSNAPIPSPSPTGLPSGAVPVVPPPTWQAPPTASVPQADNVQGFGMDPIKKAADIANATKTAENLATATQGAATIDSRIANAKDMINRMLYGEDAKGNILPGNDTSKGMAANATYGFSPESKMDLHDQLNDNISAVNARFQQLNSNLFTQELPGIVQSSGGRIDIPLINAIKDASSVPMGESPQAKIVRLNGLSDLLDKVQQNAHNQVGNISGNAPSQLAGYFTPQQIQAEIARRAQMRSQGQ